MLWLTALALEIAESNEEKPDVCFKKTLFLRLAKTKSECTSNNYKNSSTAEMSQSLARTMGFFSSHLLLLDSSVD